MTKKQKNPLGTIHCTNAGGEVEARDYWTEEEAKRIEVDCISRGLTPNRIPRVSPGYKTSN